MAIVIAWILGIATVLGGIAAVFYFRDKWHKRNHWTEEDKIVSSQWWETSDVKKTYQAKGYTVFVWANRYNVAERLSRGDQIVYETDATNKIKRTLVNDSNQILLCRR